MNTKRRLNGSTIFFFVAIHLLAVFTLGYLSWKLLFVAVALRAVTCFGIGIGFHRLLTHRGFKTPIAVEYTLIIMGCLALQGSPIRWVARHRLHHKETDKPGDLHSPNDGLFWSHMGWMLVKTPYSDSQELLNTYAPDLMKVWLYRKLDRLWFVPMVIVTLVLWAYFGFAIVPWIALQTVASWHFTWLVNSASHHWGARRFKTGDLSTNNWWVALLTLGDWHNNHHQFPWSAKHGLVWYEFDPNWWVICTLKYLRMARDLRKPLYNKIRKDFAEAL